MMSSTSFRVSIIFILSLIAIGISNAQDSSDSSLTHKTSGNEHKLLLECQHPDYRTYIKCLKRQKRHHSHNEHEIEGGETKHCFDECGMEQCESTKCVHDCHRRCMKRTKETRQIITQYETTCGGSDDCTEKSDRSDLPTANITTNIDINNVINNHMPKPVENGVGNDDGRKVSSGDGGTVGKGVGGSTGGREPCQGGKNGPCEGTNWPCTPGLFGCNVGLSLVPQVQLVPQITFGLGINSIGGGFWPNTQPGGIDCSSCGNPFMRYRCDVSCYPVQGTGPIVSNIGRTVPGNANCVSPHCVGGN